jgi:membrane protein required for colicin V production
MNWVDLTILGVIAISALVSLIRGFVREALSLVSWVVAFFVASRFYKDVSPLLEGHLQDPFLRDGAAILLLFVLTLIVGSLINYLIGILVDKSGLTGTDRVLGMVFGGLRGVLVVAAILFVLDSFTGLNSSAGWQQSILIPEFKVVIAWFFEYLKQSSTLLQPTGPA